MELDIKFQAIQLKGIHLLLEGLTFALVTSNYGLKCTFKKIPIRNKIRNGSPFYKDSGSVHMEPAILTYILPEDITSKYHHLNRLHCDLSGSWAEALQKYPH